MSAAEDFQPPRPEVVERLRGFAGRRLSAAEFEDMVRAPVSARERAEVLDLIRWFRRRYPTPAARLSYARQAYARWKQSMPGESGR
jgi:hypothetical protein